MFLLSVFVLSFWQFRHTEIPVARRIFSVANPNDFSWRNRVATWGGAVTMMADRPVAGHGWGNAEQVFREQYKPGRLEDSAAIQMNDYLMLGITCGVPALLCLLIYISTISSRTLRLSPLPVSDQSLPEPERLLSPSLSSIPSGGEGGRRPGEEVLRGSGAHSANFISANSLPVGQGEGSVSTLSTINFQPSTVAVAGAMVLLVGFWFDGGLFKLAPCVVFWMLLELAKVSPLPASGRPLPIGWGEGQGEGHGAHGLSRHGIAKAEVARPAIVLRVLAGILAFAAMGLTALHLGTPRLAVGEWTLSIARKHLVQQKEKNDFEFLAAKPIWSGKPLKTLLTHVELANYNRDLVNWKLEDQMYREFVLSPQIDPELDGEMNWRRELWENFYPRVRKESSVDAAAEIVVRRLSDACKRRGGQNSRLQIQSEKVEGRNLSTTSDVVPYKSISEIWRQQTASDAEFERIYVAALRSVGIPSRLDAQARAEFWNGAEWKPAPRPVEATSRGR